jgi:ubiquinone/menaquinone biosynthesis C-methylase UbiE
VGARNYPAAGRHGEQVFRGQFHNALVASQAFVPDQSTILDVGCATGTSTRLLASAFPQAKSILGMDLSPYFVQVAQRLLQLAPTTKNWVCDIDTDDRITYQWGNGADTKLPDASVDVVNVQFVSHELPVHVTLDIVREAHRILKVGGQFWFCEMDFQAPAYAAQRANPLLFSLIRSTEPFLDEYADGQPEIWSCLQ